MAFGGPNKNRHQFETGNYTGGGGGASEAGVLVSQQVVLMTGVGASEAESVVS